MRLYGSRIPLVTKDIVDTLVTQEHIEVLPENTAEVELDVESVLKEYLRAERQLTEEAKDVAHSRGLDYSGHQKIKRQIAERRKFGLYEESVGYIAQQVIETLLHTSWVEEIFSEDHEIRRAVAPVLRKHMQAGDSLDLEVRKRIKNLQEGTADWDIQYEQMMGRLRENQNLTE